MSEEIELNELEQKIYDKYTRVRNDGDFETLFFDSGVRHIKFGPDRFDGEKHVDFYRRAMAKALANMTRELGDST